SCRRSSGPLARARLGTDVSSSSRWPTPTTSAPERWICYEQRRARRAEAPRTRSSTGAGDAFVIGNGKIVAHILPAKITPKGGSTKYPDADCRRGRAMYPALDPAQISTTAGGISRRISEQFPGSGLFAVSTTLCDLAESSTQRATRLTRP